MSQIRVETITDRAGTGSPTFPNGVVADITGDATGLTGTPDITVRNVVGAAATFTDGRFNGDVIINGEITYEDVSNVDAIGIITARSGVEVQSGGVTVAAGGVDITAGGLSVTDGGVDVTAGGVDITAGGLNVTAGVSTFTATEVTTLTASSFATFTGGLVEKYEKAGTTLGSQPNNPLTDGNVILFTGNESGNNTINFTGVHAQLEDGETCSFTVILTPNGSGVINAVQIDGSNPNGGLKWSYGAVPEAGTSGQDIYTFQILKTGTGSSDYTVYGAAINYA